VPRLARMTTSAIALLCVGCLVGTGTVLSGASLAGAEVSAAAASSCTNASTTPIDVPGDSTVTIADTCQTSSNNLTGGDQLPPASFAQATKRGDLLAAAVLCGVLKAGMQVPRLAFPAGWHRAKKHTGGIQGGLEAAIYYQADNPGGTTSITLGHVPAGNDDVWCTTFTWEIAGAGDSSSVAASGFASVTGGNSITVGTSKGTTTGDDLVLVAETDGSQYAPNQYQVSNGFDLASVWANGQTYQPGTFSVLATDGKGGKKTTVTQVSSWLDSTAVIAALSI
jgi:hypothetical protein